MFKKFNWGHGITLFYIIFVGAVVTVLIASFSVDHSLVVDDYYAKDLAYQSQYEKVSKSRKTQRLFINNDRKTEILTLGFLHDTKVDGSVQFYRPSDKTKDFKVKIDNKETSISTDKLVRGKWVLKIEWDEDGESYYQEEIVNL